MVRARSNSAVSARDRSEASDSDFERDPPAISSGQHGTQSSAGGNDQNDKVIRADVSPSGQKATIDEPQSLAGAVTSPAPGSTGKTRRASKGMDDAEQSRSPLVDASDRAPAQAASGRATRGRASARLAGNRRKTYCETSASDLEEAELDEVDETDEVDEVDEADAAYCCSSDEEPESSSNESIADSGSDDQPQVKRRGRGRKATDPGRAKSSRTNASARQDATVTKASSRAPAIGRRLGSKMTATMTSANKNSESQTSQPLIIQSRMAGGFRVGLSRSALLEKRK